MAWGLGIRRGIRPSSNRLDTTAVQTAVLNAMKEEWQMMLNMERRASSASGVKHRTSYTTRQVYRDVMTYAEMENWQLSDSLRNFLEASTVEDVFAQMEDAVKRSAKADPGSISTFHVSWVLPPPSNSLY